MPGSRWFKRSSRPAAPPPPIECNDQGIVDSLTENNQRSMWASRRIGEGEQLYVVHVQGAAGIGLPTTLLVKKFQNANPALLVDDNVKNRCKSEMILLASICHDNIINVLHFIQREDAIMLVYEYPVNGGLDYWLHRREGGEQPLSWPQRIAIAVGVAQGLCHLHHGCNRPVVHHNINSNKILLDQEQNVKISSFGAAQMSIAGLNQPLPIADIPVGNFGYGAPEYGVVASQLTEKVDIYSFGVLLLELVTGKLANGADGLLAIWAQDNCNELMANHLKMFNTGVDKGIPHQARYMEEMAAVFRLGVDCTVGDPKQRPSMQMALKRLRRSRGRGPFHGLLNLYTPASVVKGKVAYEISSADELTLTELCSVKASGCPKTKGRVYQWQEAQQSVANLQHECKAPNILPSELSMLTTDPDWPWSHFRPDLMEVVYLWVRGLKFQQIREISQVIRAIRRLGEILQQLISASQLISETQLEGKFDEAFNKIKS
ncbi:receptor-like protein kinase HAIKU2 [Triticum aestivum]|uniref:receptor-like protein kinase HAIKU2 n=1 Tax=Triticum aestivum TaxID=4565 RepID=UPI001D00A369|nr:receptor-like protein kinase HAIKU2 [Triticum aestivum]